jgi:hypothetical protein
VISNFSIENPPLFDLDAFLVTDSIFLQVYFNFEELNYFIFKNASSNETINNSIYMAIYNKSLN